MMRLDLFFLTNPNSSPLHPRISANRALLARSRRQTPPRPLNPLRHSLSLLRRRYRCPTHRPRLPPSFQTRCERDECSGGPEIDVDDFRETGVSDLPVELCSTKTLPPALTLRHAVDSLRKEISKLKMDPPCSRSGVLRFQVVVPPSIKALSWLYSQYKTLVGYPQIYLSRQQNYSSSPAMDLADGILQVSGIGSAICFHGSSHASSGFNLIKRYLSVDSPLIRAYGFIGINYHKESSLVEEKAGSFYLFIPQIELDEFERCSILASTILWDDSLSHTLDKAIHYLEFNVSQIIDYSEPLSKCHQDMWISSIQGQSNLMDIKDVQVVYLNAATHTEKCIGNSLTEEESLTSYQFYMRLSLMVSLSTDMYTGPHRTSCSIKECRNINLVWASIIVEECVRLGLTVRDHLHLQLLLAVIPLQLVYHALMNAHLHFMLLAMQEDLINQEWL